MNKPIWNTFKCDPYNMIGESVLHGRDSLYRTRVVVTARVGRDTVQHVEYDRACLPVMTRRRERREFIPS